MKNRSLGISLVGIIAGVVFLCGSSAFPAVQRDSISHAFAVRPGGELVIESDRGSIEVKTGGENKVDVMVYMEVRTGDHDRAEQVLKGFDVTFDQEGEDVYVKAKYRGDKGWRFWENSDSRLQVRFIVVVPKAYNVDLTTAGGSIYVGDLSGKARAVSSGGSLTFENIQGPVHGTTSGGSISLGKCSGAVDVNTSGGSISIGQVEGDVVAHTSGGSVTVEEVMGSIEASTSGGSVKAHISRQPKGDCRLSTSGGNVTVYLEKSIKVDVDAETSAGKVTTDFPITIKGGWSHSSFAGSLNGGGPELYLRTSGGNIDLREL
jgi:DUF4097 and DUF4098 domain-containing protein YvlB